LFGDLTRGLSAISDLGGKVEPDFDLLEILAHEAGVPAASRTVVQRRFEQAEYLPFVIGSIVSAIRGG
jgi:hypothetical protein